MEKFKSQYSFQTLSGKSYPVNKYTLHFDDNALELEYHSYLLKQTLGMAKIINFTVPFWTYLLLGYYQYTQQWLSAGQGAFLIPTCGAVWAIFATYLCFKTKIPIIKHNIELIHMMSQLFYVDVTIMGVSAYLLNAKLPDITYIEWVCVFSVTFSIVFRRRLIFTLMSTIISVVISLLLSGLVIKLSSSQLLAQLPPLATTILIVSLQTYITESSSRISFLNEKENESWKIQFEDIEIQKMIGAGTFGKVFIGSWKQNLVAIKQLLDEKHEQQTDNKTVKMESSGYFTQLTRVINEWLKSQKSQTDRRRLEKQTMLTFEREIRVMCNLRHPNIVTFMGANLERQHMFLVTEFCENGSLFEFIEGQQYRDVDPVIRSNLALGSAQGLYYLHTQNPPIIHRDFKSLNILIDSNLNAKVCDFGFSQFASTIKKQKAKSRRKSVRNASEDSEIVGSIPWIAPEIFKGQQHSIESDTYSLGIVLWEIFSGRHPYMEQLQSGVNIEEIIVAVCEKGYRPSVSKYLNRQSPFTPPEVIDLIRSCWTTEQSRRAKMTMIIEKLAAAKATAYRHVNYGQSLSNYSQGSSQIEESSSSIPSQNSVSDQDRQLGSNQNIFKYKQSVRIEATLPQIKEAAENMGNSGKIFKSSNLNDGEGEIKQMAKIDVHHSC